MEMRFDHHNWHDASRALQSQSRWALDWPGLAARLAAGHAYQRSLTGGEALWLAPAGSFDPVAARQLIDYAAMIEGGATAPDWGFEEALEKPGYTGVNSIVLGVRKNMSGKEFGIAGPFLPAVEG